jgi:hypothetical protein
MAYFLQRLHPHPVYIAGATFNSHGNPLHATATYEKTEACLFDKEMAQAFVDHGHADGWRAISIHAKDPPIYPSWTHHWQVSWNDYDNDNIHPNPAA